MTRDGLFLRMKDEDWESVLAVNLTAAFRLSRAAVKGMMRRRFGPHHQHHFRCRRHRQSRPGQLRRLEGRHDRLVQGARAEVATRSITVNCVAPGFIESADDRRAEREAARGDPGRRSRWAPGTGGEVAAAVVYLACDEAAYVTGQTLHVNGGMAMI